MPCLPVAGCEATAIAMEGKKPRCDAGTSIKSRDAVCRKGCNLIGWTIDQFCEVCHGSAGSLGPRSYGSASGPCGGQAGAFVASDPCSSLQIGPPLQNNEGIFHAMPRPEFQNCETQVRFCIRGNGLCPLVGWTIDSYCPYCHN